MANEPLSIKQLEERIVIWAEARPNIRAILVVGSRARRDHPGDEWADLDLMVFAADFTDYLSGLDWLDGIGQVWVSLPYQTGDGDPERLVLFEGGYKVDFVFFSLDELQRLANVPGLPGVYRRGYYILIDKDGLAAQIPPPPDRRPFDDPPSEDSFLLTANAFWYGAVYVAKQIRRRELWVVKFRDWTMKEDLLKVIEWHAQASHSRNYDTWHIGRFMPEWTDPQTWDALHRAFGRFEAGDSWRALLVTMDLFRRLATETASHLGYDYPATLDEHVTTFVNTLYRADDLPD